MATTTPAGVASSPPLLARYLACPQCHDHIDEHRLICEHCGIRYEREDGVPLLLRPDHTWRPSHGSKPSEPQTGKQGLARRDRSPSLFSLLSSRARQYAPEQRVWTLRSKRAIQTALEEAANDPDHLIVNLGAGFERVFRRAFLRHPQIVRIGLPHAGVVDAYGDVTALPLTDGSVALFLSSSVMEHVRDPDDGVAEMSRVVRPGGLVYAEIPFLRSYHMAPHDYQRYTVSGIERLFARHGFDLVEKGVCSGPFTAWALFGYDTVCTLTHLVPRRLASAIQAAVAVLVHPMKYLDRLIETSPLAENQACNFYYLGRRIEPRAPS